MFSRITGSRIDGNGDSFRHVYWYSQKIVAKETDNICISGPISPRLLAVGSSLARVICETSQALPAGGQMAYLGDLLFSPRLTIGSSQT